MALGGGVERPSTISSVVGEVMRGPCKLSPCRVPSGFVSPIQLPHSIRLLTEITRPASTHNLLVLPKDDLVATHFSK